MSSDLSSHQMMTVNTEVTTVGAGTLSPTSLEIAGVEGAVGTPLARELAAQRTQMGLVARKGQENAILHAVKEQMKQLDTKVKQEFQREHVLEVKRREQDIETANRKLSSMEARLTDYERKHHRLEGTTNGLKGHYDSFESQTNTHFLEVNKAKVELCSEIRTKHNKMDQDHAEVQQRVTNLEAAFKSRSEEVNRKLERLDKLVEEKDFRLLKSLIDSCHTRVKDLENHVWRSNLENAICLYPQSSSVSSSTVVTKAITEGGDSGVVGLGSGIDFRLMEGRMQDLQTQLDDLKQAQLVSGVRVEEQKERCSSLASDLEQKRVELRALIKTNTDSLESRFKEIEGHISQIHTHRLSHKAEMDRLSTRFEDVAVSMDAHGDSLRRMQEKGVETAMALLQESDHAGYSGGATVSASVSDYALVVANLEEMMVTLPAKQTHIEKKLQMLESDREVIQQVSSFVQALKDLTPQMIDQGKRLEVLEKSSQEKSIQGEDVREASMKASIASEVLRSEMRGLEERFVSGITKMEKHSEEVEELRREVKTIREQTDYEEPLDEEDDNEQIEAMARIHKKASTTE